VWSMYADLEESFGTFKVSHCCSWIFTVFDCNLHMDVHWFYQLHLWNARIPGVYIALSTLV
jgi:hypothetical protein